MKLDSSYIFLRNLRFHAYHGVDRQEQLTGNEYEVSLRIKVDLTEVLNSDDVTDTINYAEVYRMVAQEMEKPRKLLETVAGAIAQRLFESWEQIEAIDIRLTKLNPPMSADTDGAGVELHLINK